MLGTILLVILVLLLLGALPTRRLGRTSSRERGRPGTNWKKPSRMRRASFDRSVVT
jgi:hypothetical protein